MCEQKMKWLKLSLKALNLVDVDCVLTVEAELKMLLHTTQATGVWLLSEKTRT